MKQFTIGKQDVPVEEREIEVYKLKFYPENPRVYSSLRKKVEDDPSQEEIEKHMCSLEHTKELKQSIESNGGLIDPLIVRDGDLVVLEGNSRLAAYKLLCRKDPITWAKVKCYILPADIDKSLVFQLLGQYHIIGRKDWSAYEQAGYLYRRLQESKMPIDQMAKELGITKSTANNYISVYKEMIAANDLIADRWSYYEEFLKKKTLKKAADKDPKFREKIHEKIKSGEIPTASGMRNLAVLMQTNDATAQSAIKEFFDGEISLDQAYTQVESTGKLQPAYKQVETFRKVVADEKFHGLLKDDPNLKFELMKVFTELKKIFKE